MERVLLSKNQNIQYFSLRLDAEDPPKIFFCRNCPLSHKACSVLDSGITNRIVGKINLDHPQVLEVTGQNLQLNCGDISRLV
ncbi:hypothetical protein KBB48_02075 [Candidatus Shapirobacteria bacterium]|jgi:hypothetical protein|nr:hypothetical protein [Candidatus Shapirobacteria bacterium]